MTLMQVCELRATLYHALAEALAEPPEWLALPGDQWPLLQASLELASISAACQRASTALAAIDGEPLVERQKRYRTLVAQLDPTMLCLYESGWLSGRLLGEETCAVEICYREVGLDMVGAETPDHVSLELAFLGYLVEYSPDSGSSEKPSQAEQAFLRKHAGRWLPALGRAIAGSGDPVYGPIGLLLAEWLEEATRQPPRPKLRPARAQRIGQAARQIPAIPQAAACTLCGFCAQDCRAGALVIQETEEITRLMFSPARCNGCGKCARFCSPEAIEMVDQPAGLAQSESWLVLNESPRGACRLCGATLVSLAELSYMAARLDDPNWLDLCQECRS